MAFLYEAKRGVVTQVVTMDLFKEVLTSPIIRDAISEYRQYLKNETFHTEAGNLVEAKKWKAEAGRKKATLPGWIFSARQMVEHEWIDSKKVNHGMGAWRHQDWAEINGLIMCDFDHLENVGEIYENHIAGLIEKWGVLFVFITPSGKGLKVVFKGQTSLGNIAANQQAFAKDANLELDEVCKDASRLSFVTTDLDVLYLDNQLFTYENEEFVKKYRSEYFRGVSTSDMFGGNAVPVASPSSGDVPRTGGTGNDGESQPSNSTESAAMVLDYSGYKYCGIAIEDIINKLLDNKPVAEGKRHDTIFQLAKKLRYVCERSAKKVEFFLRQLPWVQDVDAEDRNVSRTIEDAMAKPYSSYLPKDLKTALTELGYKDEEVAATDELAPYVEWGKQLETYFDKFPCLAECCYNLPYGTYPAALFVGAAFFGTLMTRTWYHYWFQPMVERRLNYGICIIGDPGSGKSFAGELYKLICEPIIAVDKVGNDAINKFKKERRLRETSDKEKKKEALAIPDNIVRIHGPRTANGVFIEDMYNAVEIVDGKEMHLHMLTFTAELDSMTIASKGGQWIDKSSLELLAFHNEEDNQQYKNLESISGPFNVYWNFVYTGTPVALAKKVNERNFGTGLFSRLGCLPMGSDYFECAEERVITKAEEARNAKLKEWAYILDKVQGELPLKPLMRCTHDFVYEIKTMAKIDDNKPDAFLVNRVPYYGINVSAPFIFMRHYKEWEESRTFKMDKYDIALCRLVMEIQMHSQRQFFGKYAQMYFDDAMRDRSAKDVSKYHRRSDDLYNQLPQTFSSEQLSTLGGLTKSAAAQCLCRWAKEKRVERAKEWTKKNPVWKKK